MRWRAAGDAVRWTTPSGWLQHKIPEWCWWSIQLKQTNKNNNENCISKQTMGSWCWRFLFVGRTPLLPPERMPVLSSTAAVQCDSAVKLFSVLKTLKNPQGLWIPCILTNSYLSYFFYFFEWETWQIYRTVAMVTTSVPWDLCWPVHFSLWVSDTGALHLQQTFKFVTHADVIFGHCHHTA